MKNKLKFIIPAAIAVIAVIIAALCIDFAPAEKADIPSLVSTAQKYLLENNYEQAIAEFNKIIDLDPMNADAYLGIAEAYIGIGDTEKAVEWLEKGYALTGDERLKNMIDELKTEDIIEETTIVQSESTIEETTITTAETTMEDTEVTTIENTTEITIETTEAVDEKVEAIRTQALEILSPFVPNKSTGEPNSTLYAYYESYRDSNTATEYKCFKCKYDEYGNKVEETFVSMSNDFGDGYEKNYGNIITYFPEYSSKMFVQPSSGTIKKVAVLINGGLSESGLDDWYENIYYYDCTYKSNNKYEFDNGYNTIILYINDNKIYEIDNNYNGYTESLIYNSDLSNWEYSKNNITPYKIGLPSGFDESIFELTNNEIEKEFTDSNEFFNFVNSN